MSTYPKPAACCDVIINFTGAVHVVDGADPAKERLIIVPNLNGAAPSHHPMLVAEADYLDAKLNPKLSLASREQRLKTDPPGTGTTFNYYEMPEGYEIDLKQSGWSNGSPVLTLSEDGDSKKVECPDDKTYNVARTSLHWLPRLSSVSKASPYKLKDALIKKDPLASDVISRLDVVDGFLTAELTARQRKFRFVQKGGAPAADDVHQAVAAFLRYRVHIDLTASKNLLTLKGRHFQDSSSVDLGVFQPRANTNTIEITIANLPPNDFFLLEKDPVDIPHFHHYYGIVDQAYVEYLPQYEKDCGSPNGSTTECGPDRLP